jgi:hypothetical protein
MTQKSLIKMQISTLKNFVGISLKKNLVPRMLSHRVNVRTSKFWQKSNETKQNFFENLPRACKDLIKVKKNSKICHACVPLTSLQFIDSALDIVRSRWSKEKLHQYKKIPNTKQVSILKRTNLFVNQNEKSV